MFLPIDIINEKKWFIKLKTTILSFVIFYLRRQWQ